MNDPTKSAPNLPRMQKPGAKNAGGKKGPTKDRRQVVRFLLWAVLFGAIVLFSLSAGALAGYQSGTGSQKATATRLAKSSVEEQFTLAMQDIAESNYEIAYRRLEYVIAQDPAFQGATDKMAEVMTILYATATPTPPPSTATPTATRDLRPVEDQLKLAQSLVADQKWVEAIDSLVGLRKEDPAFRTAKVDGLMYITLRMLGFDKIWKEGDLNGGIYDLVLASRFGPLDSQANSARDLARLYLIGSSFWEVDPVQAIQYFSQVAAAAPGLRDDSGWTASARYREVLIQYGDKLAADQEWCAAQEQYELALSMGADEALQEKTQNAALHCTPPTSTITETGEAPTALTPTETFPVGITPSPTTGFPPTATNTVPALPPTNTAGPPTSTPEPPTNTPEAPAPVETTPPAGLSRPYPYP